MTEISFIPASPMPSATVKLVAKAYARRRARGDTRRLPPPRFDTLLWEQPPEAFLPHVNLASPHAARDADHR